MREGSTSPQCVKEKPAWEMEKSQGESMSNPLLERTKTKKEKLQRSGQGVRRREGMDLTLSTRWSSALAPPATGRSWMAPIPVTFSEGRGWKVRT